MGGSCTGEKPIFNTENYDLDYTKFSGDVKREIPLPKAGQVSGGEGENTAQVFGIYKGELALEMRRNGAILEGAGYPGRERPWRWHGMWEASGSSGGRY
jgi:hypothetical protein